MVSNIINHTSRNALDRLRHTNMGWIITKVTTYSYISFFFYKDDLLTYKSVQIYATKYIQIYNMKYNKMAA